MFSHQRGDLSSLSLILRIRVIDDDLKKVLEVWNDHKSLRVRWTNRGYLRIGRSFANRKDRFREVYV